MQKNRKEYKTGNDSMQDILYNFLEINFIHLQEVVEGVGKIGSLGARIEK